jgi:hypothetical protein
MRILLDESALTRDFGTRSLGTTAIGHDCQTCRYARLKRMTNGRLLAAAEAAGFELLATVDLNVPYQQTSTALMPAVLRALEALKRGDVVRIGMS